MSGQKDARASLFLIELIIAVLFFALGSAVCVQAFAQAYTISRQAQELAFASAAVSSAANVTKYTGGALEDFQAYYPDAFEQEDGIAVAYNDDLAPCAAGQGSYLLQVSTSNAQDGMCHAHIRMTGQDGGELYALELRWPAAAEGGAP